MDPPTASPKRVCFAIVHLCLFWLVVETGLIPFNYLLYSLQANTVTGKEVVHLSTFQTKVSSRPINKGNNNKPNSKVVFRSTYTEMSPLNSAFISRKLANENVFQLLTTMTDQAMMKTIPATCPRSNWQLWKKNVSPAQPVLVNRLRTMRQRQALRRYVRFCSVKTTLFITRQFVQPG